MNLKNRFRLVIFNMITLMVSIAVIFAVGIWYTKGHFRQAIDMDGLVVNLYELQLLNGEYAETPSERVQQQWQTKYDQTRSKLIQQPNIPDDVKDAMDGLQQIFARLRSLSDASLDGETSQKRLRNQLASTLNLESQRITDWASDISRQTKDSIIAHLMLIGAVTLAIILIAALVVITIILFTTRYILSSVNHLVEGAEAIARGRLGFQVEQTGDDEIAALATAINQMSRSLMNSYDNLHQKTIQLEAEITKRQIIHEALQKKTLELEEEIQEHRRAEEATRELLLMLEAVPNCITIHDTDGNFLYANQRTFDLHGYSRDEFMALNLRKITVPATEKLINKRIQELLDVGEASFEVEHLTKNGTPLPLWISVKKMTWSGKSVLLSVQTDITERKRTEEALQQTLESLRRAVGTTIQVMVSAIEARDPYTAGHQIRSADLARAIATEMRLHPEKIEGIRLAGSIHDIGKLSIPAEILSKPTKLSDIEFSLIKEHARKGFELLKDVESPWPLAEIIHEHHERMDGSGYPRNLKGEEICIEARIIAVSDVVESMASHRPYRAGLGINAALAEIEKNKGIFYDNAVADACIKLFREKGYTLEGT